ncbi:MAG TPA: O-antigen ligase family protein [Ramlibacter sp.]|nr:O-antigen ligase family protein [Ramlibacter sp.]
MVPALVALMLFLAPTLGATKEELLQDTLKSAIVVFGTLAAAIVFAWSKRRGRTPMVWHAGLALPLLLMLYALGSMAWSHTYLAGVEAVRWFIFALLMGVCVNTLTRERLPWVSWGIAAGGAFACLWAAMQFLFDVSLFPQGPHPASTFVNRNFFAEFAICTLPFVAVLLARARKSAMVAVLSIVAGLEILSLCMTGTRAALAALWVLLFVVFPVIAWRYRAAFAFPQWPMPVRVMSVAIMVGMVGALGAVSTSDRELAAEGRGVTALERAFKRTASIAPSDSSLSIRMVMWRATARMVAANPVAGVGAGAWENAIPLYQAEGSQLETDFYVHNEFLQLVAEYGLAGWLFLLGLLAWLAQAAWRTWKLEDAHEAAWRAVLLSSLLALLIVSNAGFAWRMAATGAIYAVCLGALAASDVRLGAHKGWRTFAWRPAYSFAATAALLCAAGLAVYVTWRAVDSERKIVRASRLALTISASNDPNHPKWDRVKAEMLTLLEQGVAINPHYRKLTPVAADELARWGDWNDAIWVWESVLSSRPYVVAILTNVARGYIATGRPEKAQEYIERAQRVQPNARSVRSAEVLLLARMGQDSKALDKGRTALSEGVFDYDMCNAVFVVGRRLHDPAIAERAMQLRIASWDRERVQGWVQLGKLYDEDMHDAAKAAGAFSRALSLTATDNKPQVWEQVPAALRPRIAQMSASKG